MSKLTLNELSNSLNDYIDEKQNVEDYSLMTENKTIVGAINEIYGKEIIANAIGEPLDRNDTFTEMSNDINNLLSTFKTNMMNSGVMVESSDKFKQLIDKIKGLTEGEGNKGIQYAEGTVTVDSPFVITSSNPYTVSTNLDFIPSLIVVSFKSICSCSNITIDSIRATPNNKLYLNLGLQTYDYFYSSYLWLSDITAESFKIYGSTTYSYSIGSGDPTLIQSSPFTWYAIGIGEEDTTLRDSLASILQDKGVEITENDDMASLIGKVDEEFDRINAEASIIKTGTATITNLYSDAETFTVNINPGFVPKEIICTIKSFKFNYSSGSSTTITAPTVVYSRYNNTASTYVTISPRNGSYGADVYISSISQSNFVVTITKFTGYSIPSMSIEWTAIS